MSRLLLALLLAGCSGSGVDTTLTTLARRPVELYCGWESTGTIKVLGVPGTCWLVTPKEPWFASSPAGLMGPCDGIVSAPYVYAASDRLDTWVGSDHTGAAEFQPTPAACP